MENVKTPLFDGIGSENMDAMLSCTGYHIGTYQKGQVIILEEEQIRHVGIVLSGAVDMVKEDVWGNKTLLARMEKMSSLGRPSPAATITAPPSPLWHRRIPKCCFCPFTK